jgi:transcription elongation factor GreA-like protein
MNDHAEYLEVKLTTVTEQRDEWANLWAELSRSCVKDYVKLERELISITEQRDELLRYNEAFRKETLICADCDAIRKEEYDQAIEQRDRLADIVKKIRAEYGGQLVGTDCDCSDCEFLRPIDEALQSLTTNEL